uniref:Translation elongation factor P/YeiP central domain-containing protein n=1 Tax=Phaseolus vulgaris TaxID=3885 RepID=V7D3K8_PHAVU|nr:hypothetical protein PHAVU_001G269400g [Phaseolus vulgaris]ESW35841.1 hypothetical protein PHAVU_001G269400g [Phaseolus vulgaris]
MQTMWLRLSNSDTKSLIRLSSYLYSSYFPTPLSFISLSSPCRASSTATNLFASPWSSSQHRGIKVSGSDVLKVDHSHEGRGKATIKVELRDIGQGNKVTQRMGTNDDIERVYVQVKTFMFMCMDRDGTVVLMDPDTLDQMEVSKDLFNKDCLYLRDEMKVKVQFYDDKPLSASVPKRVSCIVKEVIAATPRNKKVVLDNGLTIEVPPHIVPGDAIVVNTEDDSYIERAKS